MKKFLFLICAVVLCAVGCSQKPAANTNTASTTGTPKPASSTSSSTASASPKNEKKAPATNPVPADWIRMYDDAKGYEFMVPDGTKHDWQTVNGVDVYVAGVPAPYELGVMVVAFKNKNLTKDDLIKQAEDILKNLGEASIKIDSPKELTEDYSLATYTSTGKDNKPGKGKILVGTDVTDNYIVFVEGDADKYAANEKTIDEIWGSFAMYSGGSSGNS